ncbi:hypothetical protein MBLNU457_2309t2 [Dothideomycetes sp. NU457]
MAKPKVFGGPTLPKELLNKIGAGNGKNKWNAPTRKQARKDQRKQKKLLRTQPRALTFQAHEDLAEEDSDEDDEEPSPPPSPPPPSSTRPKKTEDSKPVKSILKKDVRQEPELDDEFDAVKDAEIPRMSRTVRDRLAQDDAEIAALEKKLGIKSKKKKGKERDALDNLLGDIDEAVVDEKPSKRKLAEDEEWLNQKRRKVARGVEEADVKGQVSDDESIGNEDDESSNNLLDESDEEDEDEDGELDGDSELEAALNGDSDDDMDINLDDIGEEEDEDQDGDENSEDDDSAEDDFGGFEDEDEEPSRPKVRENPYLPGTTGVQTAGPQIPAGKYVPPSLRKASASEDEEMQRLRRQVQGQINRLSEANMLSILQAVEKFYQDNPRQHVTSSLINILVTSISDKTSLMDTFLILHAGFIAAIYKVIGPDFGAQVIERVTGDLDRCLNDPASGKQANNLVSLLSELYNFQVIGPGIMFDYVRTFIQDITEENTELLLRVIRVSGGSLRQDDPSALKEIVLHIQKNTAKVGEANLSVRQKFMIETINDLKNNRMKTGLAASAVVSEHTTRMKKTLGTLNTRNLRANEPLRTTLDDIRNTEKKGKWWLVGASYHDPAKMASNDDKPNRRSSSKTEQVSADDATADLLELAREQRMNTDIRRAIFISIMSATDYKDANVRLLKLSLKKAQMLEIPRVLIHCTGAEATFNPYYTLIAKRLCDDRKLRMSFQFALWDLFKQMGERDAADDEDDDENEEGLDMRKILNLAKMFASMISDGALSVTVFKNLNFAYLQPKTTTFLEILMTTVILKSAEGGKWEQSLDDIISKAHEVPEMVSGLRYFIESVVSRSEIVVGKTQRKALSVGCKTALRALRKEQS